VCDEVLYSRTFISKRSMTGQSTLHVNTAFCKLIVSIIFTFYE